MSGFGGELLGAQAGIAQLAAARAAVLKAVANTITKATLDCEGQAKALAPVNTGFLKSSIYSELHDRSTYGNADTPPSGATVFEEIPRPKDPYTGMVAVGASYGAYVELGTVHMAAQPYLGPALDAVRPSFNAAMERLEVQLMGLSFGMGFL